MEARRTLDGRLVRRDVSKFKLLKESEGDTWRERLLRSSNRQQKKFPSRMEEEVAQEDRSEQRHNEPRKEETYMGKISRLILKQDENKNNNVKRGELTRPTSI